MCSPVPPLRTLHSAAAIANAAYSAAVESASGTPHFAGRLPGSPVTLMTPLIACTVMSKPPSAARGPVWPYAETEQ
jgi:hypothetical protein